MDVFRNLKPDILAPLDRFRDWMMSAGTQAALRESIAKKPSPYSESPNPEEPSSVDYLMKIDHPKHVGFPVHMHGIDLNYAVLQNDRVRVSDKLFKEARERDHELDDELQLYLGARLCALKAFYPERGHIGWHTNWNASGYNIIFTYSPTGNGYWRHIQPSADSGLKPDPNALVHIADSPGWHCKVGYFGHKQELDRVVWHAAYTNEPRITVSYLISDKGIWENMVQEIRKG